MGQTICRALGIHQKRDQLLVLIPTSLRYLEVVRIKDIGEKDIIEAFNKIFARHGTHRVIRTDNSIAAGREDILQAEERDKLKKERMKECRDGDGDIRSYNSRQGGLILLRRNSTKHTFIYNPELYLVIKVDGTQSTGAREGHREKT